MRYFIRRILFFLLTLWAAVTLNFIIPRLQPGDPAEAIVRQMVGQNASIDPAQLQAVRTMLGAPNGNVWNQYLVHLRFKAVLLDNPVGPHTIHQGVFADDSP